MLFTIFTGALTLNHGYLVLANVTTVEQLSIQSMRHKESALLDTTFPAWDIKCVNRLLRHILFSSIGVHRGKRRKVREWDAEWGRIGREGNLWWLGSSRANWEAVMGPGPLYWFCE
jgi:palmitoyltransferase